MRSFLIGGWLLLLAPLSLWAQHQELSEKPATWQGEIKAPRDTSSLLYCLKRGHFQGHFRYYLMATDNERGLADFYANAVGGGLRYESALWRRLSLTLSGFFIFNTLSSDLTLKDSLTGQGSRYELGLFDLQDPANKTDLDRLEELNISYKSRRADLRFGRQLLNTPFINLQDGRMRPTLTEGLWAGFHPGKRLRLEGGWIYRISPRSTVRWYNVGESIGIYPSGVQPDGTRSAYAGLLRSRGIFITGLKAQPHTRLSLQAWEMWIQNISHTALLQADYVQPLPNKQTLKLAFQVIGQHSAGEGGHPDPLMAYYTPGDKALSWGSRLAWTSEKWELSGNYNRITALGRFLMPREWGRDPFFTFMPRERNEGLGDVHAANAQLVYKSGKRPLKLSLSSGYYHLPDVKSYALNKYGLPSYWQTNVDLRYVFGGSLKGIDAQLLIVAKRRCGETYDSPRNVINKVNMMLYNLVVNYHF